MKKLFVNLRRASVLAYSFLLFAFCFLLSPSAFAWQGMPLPRLHQEGRFLCDPQGNHVNLHGFMYTPNAYFCNGHFCGGDVTNCLDYTEKLFKIMSDPKRGFYCNYVRLHLDPCWTNDPKLHAKDESDISAFTLARFDEYMRTLYKPIIRMAAKYGLYVIVRPPGVCPPAFAEGDAYHRYLKTVWNRFTQDPYIVLAPHVMIELANEPVDMLFADGKHEGNSPRAFAALRNVEQDVVDTIRANGFENMIWLPGLGYQSLFSGLATNRVVGANLGYSAHFYPGFLCTGSPDPAMNNADYKRLEAAWAENIKPVADFAPLAITELDWSLNIKTNAEGHAYNTTWGWGLTGTEKDPRAGLNIKRLMDSYGNVSWNLCTGWLKDADVDKAELALADLGEQACIVPTIRWFKEYAAANTPRPDFSRQSVSDTWTNTFVNTVIRGDFPDVDVVRAGNKYYLMSTTMFYFPGATLLESDDMVNWRWCANPLEQIADDDAYNLVGGHHRYAAGMWGSAMAYHDGIFYLLLNTVSEKEGYVGLLLTAANPHGPWTKKRLPRGYYDCGLMFDRDGKIYVVTGRGKIWICELDKDFNCVKEQQVAEGGYKEWKEGLEGNRLYHIGEYYYIYNTYGGWPSGQTCFRSKNIWGPYEEKLVVDKMIDGKVNTVHQGCLVQTPAGEWWSMLFEDLGPIGRCPNLQKVTWKDGWPTIGENGDGRPQKVVSKEKLGVKRFVARGLATNDAFRDPALGLQWQWNHNPDNAKWSLSAAPGFLRLGTASVTNDLYGARNTLTQRILGYSKRDRLTRIPSLGTVKMLTSGMKEGDVAGLAVFQDPYAMIGVEMTNGEKRIVWRTNSFRKPGAVETLGPAVAGDVVYFRATVDFETGRADFSFSTDNKDWTAFGEPFRMNYDLTIFVGNRYAIFNYATQSLGGHVDVDWFTTESDSFEESKFFNN